ncbi:MAG: HesA/MoeB/ThiF family protein [Dehalococcoidales bacterium]|jgi:adenylyltransferase/sulfurtransferase|nr:HesA/MoeB/ThiF family protein [Dehalococcoidales bacterium]
MLTPSELQRYQRQIMLNGFGETAQEKLKRAKVFIGGAGGLGSPVALYLAAAGIGTLRIVDSDAVELSNLNRQILHWTRDIGKNKVDSAREKLAELNPEIRLEAIHEKITEENVFSLVSGCDAVVDAMDNLNTRYLLNKTAITLNLPYFHGAVYGLEGRAMTILPGQTACLMCIYQGVNISQKVPVIGATPGLIACVQATEVIKYFTGIGQLLTGRLLIYDGLNMRFAEVKVNRNPSCSHCAAISPAPPPPAPD